MSPEIQGIVKALQGLRSGVTSEASPKGLPKPISNSDQPTSEMAYADEGLTDPGIQNPVTGNGGGPVLGRRSRASGGNN